jgi:predicted transposase YbfD/YdcC
MPSAALAPSFPSTGSPSCRAPAGLTPASQRTETVASLLPYLQAVPDPRSARGRRYPLPLLFLLVLTGLGCGCLGYLSITRWARALRPDDQRQLGFAPGRTPCAATLLNLFRRLDWEAFAQQLHQWCETVGLPASTPGPAGTATGEPPWLGLALDGKALRASRAAGATVGAIVSVVAHHLGVSVAEIGVAEKQGELTVAPELLTPVLGAGRVITGDALFTQRDLCEQILAGGSEYVLIVKENQPTLLEEVQAVFGVRPRREREAQQRASIATTEQGHGRIENRWLVLATVTPDEVHWPGVAQGFLVERRRYHPARNGKPAHQSTERVYGITSLERWEAGPATVLRLQRGHWSIENQVHWVLDTLLREDERRIRDGTVARGMAAFRRAALNLLRRLGTRSLPEASDRAKANPALFLRALGAPTKN